MKYDLGNDTSLLLTQEEAAAMMRKSIRSVTRMRKQGLLRFIPGRPIRIATEDVKQLVESQLIRATQGKRPGPRKLSGEELGQRMLLRHRLRRDKLSCK